jgi:hypothetical protein
MAGNDISITVSADIAKAISSIKTLQTNIDKLTGKKIIIDSSTEKTIEKLSVLKNELKALTGKSVNISAATGEAKNEISNLSRMIDSLSNKTVSVNVNQRTSGSIGSSAKTPEVRSIGDIFSTANSSGGSFLDTLSKITVSMYGIIDIAKTVGETLKSIFGAGFGFDQQMETYRMGIAGVLASMTTWNGKATDINTAFGLANNALAMINQKAVTVGLKTEDLATAFQAILAPSLQAKMTLEQIVGLATVGTKAVKTILGPQGNNIQIAQELRAMISGTINQDATVSKSLGITNADVENAKTKVDGLYGYLMGKMSGINDLASGAWQNSMTGTVESFQSRFSQASGSAYEESFNDVKVIIQDLNKELFVTDEATGKIMFNSSVLSAAKELQTDVEILAGNMWKGANATSQFLSIFGGVSGIARSVAENINGIVGAIASWVIINKMVGYMNAFKMASIEAEIATRAVGTAGMEAGVKTAAGATTASRAFNGLTGAIDICKLSMRAFLSSTLIGLGAVAAGWAIEKLIDKVSSTSDKANKLANKGKTSASPPGWGSLSAAHEGDYDTVSTGESWGDAGGNSYGKYQFTSKDEDGSTGGTVSRFVQWLKDQGYDAGYEFEGLSPGSFDYTNRWKDVVSKYGDSFKNAYEQFAKEQYYDPEASYGGLYADQRGRAVQEAVFSTSIQHGGSGYENIIDKIKNNNGIEDFTQMDDETFLKQLYAMRAQVNPSDSNRYSTELQEALDMNAQNPSVGTQTQNTNTKIDDKSGELALKQAQLEKKAVVDAQIKLAEAQAQGNTDTYLASLEGMNKDVEEQYKRANAGTGEPMDVNTYITKRKDIEQAKADAEISLLNVKISEVSKKNTAQGAGKAENINVQADIAELQGQINTRQQTLANTLSELDNLAVDSNTELNDLAASSKEKWLETQGKYTQSTDIKNTLASRSAISKLSSGGYTEAVDAINKQNQVEMLQAQIKQTSEQLTNIQFSQKDNLRLINPNNAYKEYAASMNRYLFDTEETLYNLNSELSQAKAMGLKTIANGIQKEINSVYSYVSTMLESTLSQIKKINDYVKQSIEKNPSLTTGQKKQEEMQYDRQVNQQTSQAYYQAAQAEWANNPALAKEYLYASRLSDTMGKLPDQFDKVRGAAKQGLENGLTTFFENGTESCNNLLKAIGNLALAVLSEVNKIFSNQIVQSLMNTFFGSDNNSTRPSLGGVSIQGPLQASGAFASGGDIGTGLIQGPGTATSDSILAYSGRYKKFMGVANGEYMVSGLGVNTVGKDTLDLINQGINPKSLSNYASGGDISDGASSLASSVLQNQSLTKNNVSVPVKIVNLHDPNQIANYLNSTDGARTIINVINGNKGIIKRL